MGRTTGIVVGVEILIDVGDDLVVGGVLDRCDLLTQLLLSERALGVLLVGLFGEPELGNHINKGVLVAAVVFNRLVPGLVKVILGDGDVVLLLRLREQVLAGDGIDDVLAIALGRKPLLRQVRRPVFIALIRALAQAHDLLGDGVFLNVDAVHGCRDATRELIVLLALHLVEHAGTRHRTHGKQHGGDANHHEHNLACFGKLFLARLLHLLFAWRRLGHRVALDLGASFTHCHLRSSFVALYGSSLGRRVPCSHIWLLSHTHF